MTPRAADSVSVIEAAYRVDGTLEAWAAGIVLALADAFGYERRGFALMYDATRPDWVDPRGLFNVNLPEALIYGMFQGPVTNQRQRRRLVRTYRTIMFGTARDSIQPIIPEYEGLFDPFGIEDMACFNATDPTFNGCLIALPARIESSTPRARYLRRQVSAHISAGLRLRRVVDRLVASNQSLTAGAEAVLTREGRVEHAVGAAKTGPSRAALREALVRIDAARRARRADESGAVDLWQGLVGGRWSLVEHFETDGRQYFLAHRNDPLLARARALTLRQRQIWSYAAMGRSNKLIAYSLGLSPSTVATHLGEARRKLGSRATLSALQALMPPPRPDGPATTSTK